MLRARNKATLLLANQSQALREVFNHGAMPINFFIEMEKALKELLEHQGRSERIKNFPYPRQYAIVSTIFIRFFCVLLPTDIYPLTGVYPQGGHPDHVLTL